jgi:hypothetical protein
MDMDQSAVFLAGSILTALGFIVFVIAIVIVNNIVHKYWKPVRVFTEDSWSGMKEVRYTHPEELERIAPVLEENKINVNNKKSNS